MLSDVTSKYFADFVLDSKYDDANGLVTFGVRDFGDRVNGFTGAMMTSYADVLAREISGFGLRSFEWVATRKCFRICISPLSEGERLNRAGSGRTIVPLCEENNNNDDDQKPSSGEDKNVVVSDREVEQIRRVCREKDAPLVQGIVAWVRQRQENASATLDVLNSRTAELDLASTAAIRLQERDSDTAAATTRWPPGVDNSWVLAMGGLCSVRYEDVVTHRAGPPVVVEIEPRRVWFTDGSRLSDSIELCKRNGCHYKDRDDTDDDDAISRRRHY